MKRIYLILVILGFVLPYYFFISFLIRYGLNLPLILEQLFATPISTFSVDLLLTAIVTLVFRIPGKRIRLANWWYI
jgi:hypothetical protein